MTYMRMCRSLMSRECAGHYENVQGIKVYKYLVQYEKRQYKCSVREDLENACGKNSQVFWNIFKSLPCNHIQQEHIAPDDIYEKLESVSTMPKENYFNGDFEAECNIMLKRFNDQSTSGVMNDPMLNILNSNVTEEEIMSAVSRLKNKKWPGFGTHSC